MKKIKSGSIVVNPSDLLQGSVQDLIEDRSAYLRSDDTVTWTGTQLEFTADIILEVINTANGAIKAFTISSAQSPMTLNNNESAYIAVDRASSGAETIIKSDTVAIPSHSNDDKDIFILFRRKTAGGADFLHLPLHKQLLSPGQVARLGVSGVDASTIAPEEIQDFTTISTVGSSDQQAAGHIWRHANGGYNEPNTAFAELEAYYKFASGAMTTDETGNFTLTNNGATPNAAGITGSNFAADFDGTTQYFTQGTLLDTTPAAIAVDCWFNSDDGDRQSRLWGKINVDGNDLIDVNFQTDGSLSVGIIQGGTSKNITSTTVFKDGATGWNYFVFNWDTVNGMRLWINGVLEAQDTSATTLMASGTDRDFIIGAINSGGTVSNWFDGKISMFRVRDKTLSQTDVDVGYATEYTVPGAISDTDFLIQAQVQKEGDTDFTKEYHWSGVEVARNTSFFYRAGGLISNLSSTDKLKILART